MIGRKINNYEIVSLLGEGGMGSVYVAEHPVLNRRVAVKVLKREFAEDKMLVARFINEARAASAIRHPHIIEIMDVGTLPDGIPYLMMDLLEGQSLASRLFHDQRLPVSEAVSIAMQAATALGAAHAKEIVHRDLKPDNLFLVPDAMVPGGLRVVVLDFGIAKLRGDLSAGSVRTHSGSVLGTPPYMAPEQCRGLNDEIDHRTDIYALGVILHEMLIGRPPFVGAGFGDLLVMHITQPPPPLRSLDPTVSPRLEAAVLRALEKPRDARFASMAEFKDALAALPRERTLTAELPVSPGQGERETRVASVPAPLPRTLVAPRTTSTLSATASEHLGTGRLSTDRSASPERRSRRVAAALGLAVATAGIAAAILALVVARRPPVPPAEAPPPGAAAAPGPAASAGPAPVPAPPPPATTATPSPEPTPLAPAPVPPPAAAPATVTARPAVAPAAAAAVAPAAAPDPSAPAPARPDAVLEPTAVAPAPKRAPGTRPPRSKSRAAEITRDRPAPASAAAASAPTSPSPAAAPAVTSAPAARPKPRLSTDKW